MRELQRTQTGWRLVIGSAADPEVVEADAVLLCVPPAPAARLLAGHASVASSALGGVETASSAVVTLAVQRTGVDELPGSGFLVPPVEGRTIKASTFSFRKWAWTGALSDEVVHLRASFGRAREEADLQRDDADLVAVAVAEIGEAHRPPPARTSSTPTCSAGAAACRSTPSATSTGSPSIRADVARLPGIEVAGAVYDGVGIPAVVASATRAAHATVQHLSSTATRTGDHPA